MKNTTGWSSMMWYNLPPFRGKSFSSLVSSPGCQNLTSAKAYYHLLASNCRRQKSLLAFKSIVRTGSTLSALNNFARINLNIFDEMFFWGKNLYQRERLTEWKVAKNFRLRGFNLNNWRRARCVPSSRNTLSTPLIILTISRRSSWLNSGYLFFFDFNWSNDTPTTRLSPKFLALYSILRWFTWSRLKVPKVMMIRCFCMVVHSWLGWVFTC